MSAPTTTSEPFSSRVATPCNDRTARKFSFSELEPLPDEELMQLLQLGHTDSLAVLFERYRRLVFTIAFKLIGDVAEAEDAMQTIFLEVHRLAAQYDPARGTVKVWLLQVAYHRSINHHRHLKRRDFYSRVELSELPEQAALEQPPISERQQLLAEALEQLPAHQAKVIQMACFEGLTFREIATATGQSLGNVRHHYYRGINRLRAVATQASSREALTASQGMLDAKA